MMALCDKPFISLYMETFSLVITDEFLLGVTTDTAPNLIECFLSNMPRFLSWFELCNISRTIHYFYSSNWHCTEEKLSLRHKKMVISLSTCWSQSHKSESYSQTSVPNAPLLLGLQISDYGMPSFLSGQETKDQNADVYRGLYIFGEPGMAC